MNNIEWLEKWHKANSFDNGYALGISICTLDNPGWCIKIDLHDTNYKNMKMNRIRNIYTDDDWYDCWINDGEFMGYGDCLKLDYIIGVFREVIEKYSIDR